MSSSFFSFEFIPDFSDAYYNALREYVSAEETNKLALDLVKKAARGTSIGDEYAKTHANSVQKWHLLKKTNTDQQVFGFKSIHFFWERFGLFLGIFVYTLYNLTLSFHYERKNLGSKMVHGLILSVCIFYFFWIFQQFQDFNKLTYYLMTFASAGVIVVAVSLISKYQHLYINSLKRTISRLAAFSFLHTRKDKKPEMLQMFKELSEEY